MHVFHKPKKYIKAFCHNFKNKKFSLTKYQFLVAKICILLLKRKKENIAYRPSYSIK